MPIILIFLVLLATPTIAMAEDFTATELGDYTFIDGSEGTTGTDIEIGDYSFGTYTDEEGNTTSCTTTNIGNISYTSCN